MLIFGIRHLHGDMVMIRSAIGCLLVLLAPSVADAQNCVGNPIAVQVLGSDGPIDRERASTSYVLWVGTEAKILVDMGGGAFLRFRQSQAKLSDY